MRNKSMLVLGTVLTTVLGLNVIMGTGANATHEPANKVSAAGSDTEVLGPNADTVILSERVKTSKPTDLILGVTLECSIVTDVSNVGSDDETAFGEIKVWVEIDDVPVPVAAQDADAGRVVFCNRTHQQQTDFGDDEEHAIRTFLRTREANGFNWMALNTGSATHTIEVHAVLTQSGTCPQTLGTSGNCSQAVIGNRTLIVEPTKSANDEAVTELAP